jgi:tetratricopeptide (TPR) repeat protein
MFLQAVLLAAFLQMQPGQVGTIRVEVPPPFEGALKHTQIILRNTNGWMAVPSENDGDFGFVLFDRLAVGSYEVLVNADGYEPQLLPVGIGDSSRTVVVKVTLRPRGGSRGSQPAVSVDELKRPYPKKAIEDYEKAVEEHRKGNTSKAIELLLSAIKVAPDHYAAHNTLGTVYQKAKRLADAEDAYKRASELRPQFDEPLVNLGGLYVLEAEVRAAEGPPTVRAILNEARDVLRRALGINRSAMGYYLLGTVYYRSGVYPEAAESLQLALQIEPRMPAARLQLGNVYIRGQLWDLAVAQFDAYIAENPNAPDRNAIQETRTKVIRAKEAAILAPTR